MLRAGLIWFTAALLTGSAASAQQLGDLAPSFNACAHTHQDRDLYFATVAEDGWVIVTDRDAALARISDSFLPVLGPSALSWEETLTARAENGVQAAAELIGVRDIYGQDDHLLVIGGYENDDGNFRLDCWLVLPDATLTDAVFTTAEDQAAQPEIRMAAFAGPPHEDGSVTRIMAVQLQPDTPAVPPLAGKNGLYIQTVVPAVPDSDNGPDKRDDN